MSQKYNHVGVDISLLSTGVCCITDGVVKYGSLLNGRCLVKKNYTQKDLDNNNIYKRLYDNGNGMVDEYQIHSHEFNSIPKKQVSSWDANIMWISQLLSVDIFMIIRDLVDSDLPTIIGIENYSYGSKGDATIQIITLSVHMKRIIKEEFGDYTLISGPEIKKFAGHGGFNKKQMYERFLESSNCPLAMEINRSIGDPEENNIYITKGKKGTIKKPIDDLIDSYWIAKYMSENSHLIQ